MKTATEFLRAISTATDNYFEEFSPKGAAYLDEVAKDLSRLMQTSYGPERDREIFFEGMLWGVKLKLRARALAVKNAAEAQGLDPASGLEKGLKPS